MTEAASLQAKGRENSGFGRSRQDGRPRKMPSTAMTESAAVTTPLFWQSPSPDPRLGTRRYLLRRRHCWEPVRLAARQHPDLAPLVAALFAFVTDGILVQDGEGPPQPLLHHAFDQAWALHAGGSRHGEQNGIDPTGGPVPLVACLVIPTLHIVAAELAGVRLHRGLGLWSPQTSEPLRDWLERHSGTVTLHNEPPSCRNRPGCGGACTSGRCQHPCAPCSTTPCRTSCASAKAMPRS